MACQALTLRSSRTPPALPSALSQHSAIPALLIASVQAWPLSFNRWAPPTSATPARHNLEKETPNRDQNPNH
jgi:hypothetical protein